MFGEQWVAKIIDCELRIAVLDFIDECWQELRLTPADLEEELAMEREECGQENVYMFRDRMIWVEEMLWLEAVLLAARFRIRLGFIRD